MIDEVGRVGESVLFRRFALPHQPREAAGQHLAHHRVIVAGGEIGVSDVEGAVLVLDETVRPRDHHRADRVRPHDVGIVVDLDPADRVVDAKGGLKRGEQLLLARGLGELARQRLARVARRGVHEVLLFAAARDADPDPVAGAGAQHLAQGCGARRGVAEQHESRGGTLEVELGQKGVQHLLGPQRPVRAREIGAVAPVLVGAEEEGLDAILPRLFGDREHVGLGN